MNNQTLVIRPFDAALDTDRLSAIWLDASLAAHPFLGEDRIRDQQRLITDTYLPMAETWVACLNGLPSGFISLLDCFVGGIFVCPRHQGRGVGRSLIAHALDLKGSLTLEVYLQNPQAVAFYDSLGFAELSRRAADDQGLPFANARMQIRR